MYTLTTGHGNTQNISFKSSMKVCIQEINNINYLFFGGINQPNNLNKSSTFIYDNFYWKNNIICILLLILSQNIYLLEKIKYQNN